MTYHIFDLGENNQIHKSHLFLKKQTTKKQQQQNKPQTKPKNCLFSFLVEGFYLTSKM